VIATSEKSGRGLLKFLLHWPLFLLAFLSGAYGGASLVASGMYYETVRPIGNGQYRLKQPLFGYDAIETTGSLEEVIDASRAWQWGLYLPVSIICGMAGLTLGTNLRRVVLIRRNRE
jgi:hypothetical protein